MKEPKINAVYTTYNQYGAKTGRFSSSDTVSKINLQNIPSKEKRIRKIFKARDGYKLVGGDFSQIEPRVLAFLSGDESMINATKMEKIFMLLWDLRCISYLMRTVESFTRMEL